MIEAEVETEVGMKQVTGFGTVGTNYMARRGLSLALDFPSLQSATVSIG
jgi:hypothetical protein